MEPLKNLLKEDECIIVPGVYDCISAKLAEQNGYSAGWIGGYLVEASLLGLPDMGFTNLTDLASVCDRIVNSVSLPIIVDADTGYGGVNQVWDTVKRLEKTGVTAMHIEDQTTPKKCGGMSGRTVIPAEEMIEKIKAALSARTNPDMLIMARTDAKESLGISEAIRRLNLYLEEGADVALYAEPYSHDELKLVGSEVTGLLATVTIPGWAHSTESVDFFSECGINLLGYPMLGLYAATKAIDLAFKHQISNNGVTKSFEANNMVDFSWFADFVELECWEKRCKSFYKEVV